MGAPGKQVFATLAMYEDYKEDAPTFAYNTTQGALIVLLEHITSVDKIPPDIQGLEKYFTPRNLRWIE